MPRQPVLLAFNPARTCCAPQTVPPFVCLGFARNKWVNLEKFALLSEQPTQNSNKFGRIHIFYNLDGFVMFIF